MQLKWLRFRFRGCRGMFRVWIALGVRAWIGSRLPRTPVGSRPTAVASGPEGRSGGTSALVWRTYSRPSGGPGATEERREFSRVQRRPLGAGSPLCVWAPRCGLRAVFADGRPVRAGGRSRLALWLLVLKWLHPTRLETRTKECNMRASLWVVNPSAQ